MLRTAGGNNIAGKDLFSSAKVSPEWVVSQKPEFVIKVVSSSETRPLEEIATNLKMRTGREQIPAVLHDHVYAISNYVEFGPRSSIGLVYTAKILHPDLFRDMDPRTMLTDYAGKYVRGADISIPIYPDAQY